METAKASLMWTGPEKDVMMLFREPTPLWEAVALGNGDPGSEGDAVTLVFAFMTIPLTLLGAALGTLMGKALERYTVHRGNKWPG